jgi:NADPH:quinone reductase-like Zn-dependent oxidoreductase
MVPALIEATARNGRMVVYGNSADAESCFRIERLYNKGVTMYGFRVFTTVAPEQAVRDMANLAEQAVAGRLAVQVQATAPLADTLPLIRDLYARKVTGKVVITRA